MIGLRRSAHKCVFRNNLNIIMSFEEREIELIESDPNPKEEP